MKKKILKSVMALTLAFTFMFAPAAKVEAAPTAHFGVDVSKHRGLINWYQAKAAGVEFAMIKVGSTNTGVDPYFVTNIKGAQAAGIRTGVYLYSYANSVQGAINEANLCIQWMEGYGVNLPVAYDVENKAQKALDANTVTAMANAFCDTIAAAGYTPIVYSYKNFFARYITNDLRYDKWVAQYSDHCDIFDCAMWQYSSSGTVAGIPGTCDVNWMNKDYINLIPANGFADDYYYLNYRKIMGNQLITFNGQSYHLGDDSKLTRGIWWTSPQGKVYYFDKTDGHAVTGFVNIDGFDYYFNADGTQVFNQNLIITKDHCYHVEPDGKACIVVFTETKK